MVKQKLSELSKINLSVALATFNEENNLKDCLNSIRSFADEIVVVDGSSTDRSVEIARSFGAKVIITDNKPIFHLNKQEAINECKGEWILLLDADERVNPQLAEEISEKISASSEFSAYWINRKKMFLGKWIKKGGQYPDSVIRLFKKGKAYLPCKSVHEQIQVEGKTGFLRNDLVHLPTPSFSFYLTKDNRYSTLSCLEMKRDNLAVNFLSFLKYFIWEPNRIFFSLYIRHKGFLDGFPGFVFAFYSGLHKTSSFVKYWEMKNNQERDIKEDWI